MRQWNVCISYTTLYSFKLIISTAFIYISTLSNAYLGQQEILFSSKDVHLQCSSQQTFWNFTSVSQ